MESQEEPTFKRFHRVATVRRERGLSILFVASQLGCHASDVTTLEDESRDLKISELRRWLSVLGVPLKHLLIDSGFELSDLEISRTQVVRLIETASALKDESMPPQQRRLAETLVNQLLEMAPYLKDTDLEELDSLGHSVPTDESRAD